MSRVLTKADKYVVGEMRDMILEAYIHLLNNNEDWPESELDAYEYEAELEPLLIGIVEEHVTDEVLIEWYESAEWSDVRTHFGYRDAVEYMEAHKAGWVAFVGDFVADMENNNK